MNFEEIQTFVELCNNLNFTQTAHIMCCTQAAVSQRIKRIESQLDTTLFIRLSRNLELTTDGEIFLEYAKKIINTFQQSKQHILQNKMNEHNTITISSSSTPGTYLLPDIIYQFRTDYPYLKVINHVQYTKNVIQCVEDGTIPIGIISKPSIKSSNIEYIPLVNDDLALLVPPDHPWTLKQGIYLKELQNETFLISNPHTSMISFVEEKGHMKFDPSHIYVVGHIEAIKRSICSHMGVSIISRSTVLHELKDGLLKEVKILDDIDFQRTIFFIYKKDTTLNLSEQTFFQYLKTALKV